MVDLLVTGASRPLVGSVPAPADKSLTHRALLLASLARGVSALRFRPPLCDDNRSTQRALEAMGVRFDERGPGELVVHGAGLEGLREPAAPLDCGNSGTTMRLLAGVLAAQRFRAVLVGDASLSRRPMARVVRPLRLRGARLEGRIAPERAGEVWAPLEVGPLPATHRLSELEHDSPIASAQVKSAVLLSGLWADGDTYVREPVLSRDHTERMLRALGVPIDALGPVVRLDHAAFSGELPAFELAVPGDPSAAAFLVAAALLVPGSRVDVRDVCLNPTRIGAYEVLRDMGADVGLAATGEQLGEPVGVVRAAGGAWGGLVGAKVGGETITRAIDEVPILAAVAARARGVTTIIDAGELRAKESDRVRTVVDLLRAFGISAEEQPDGLTLRGAPEGRLRPAVIETRGDHRIAMSAAVLALAAEGETRIRDADPIATSFPRFVGTLRALGADVRLAG